jgi:hypothetical protein
MAMQYACDPMCQDAFTHAYVMWGEDDYICQLCARFFVQGQQNLADEQGKR